ncbi:CBS domain-containing protein [Tessaracoccus flavus]|nr:CBS domain-containing protein [Tessaracoccus flavus]SDY86883.1 CBS domain-containing protein [Tessaracoccus flavus]
MTSNDAYSSRDTELLPGSIEQYIDDDVPTCRPDATIEQIRATLTGRTFASVDEVAVLTDNGIPRLVGLIPIGTALAATPSLTAADVMDSDPPVIHRGFNEEQAAWKAVRHGESSLAVVDDCRGPWLKPGGTPRSAADRWPRSSRTCCRYWRSS